MSLVKYERLNNISHYHGDYELVYVNQGSVTVSVNETIFNLEEAMCVFIHSNDIHYVRSGEDAITTVLKGDGEYFGSIFEGKRLLCALIGGVGSIYDQICEIERELRTCEEYGELLADCLTTKLFIDIMRREKTVAHVRAADGKPDAAEIYRIISKKISGEYATLTFTEAAEYMHFSKPYFSKVFHSVFGMTFTHYLNTVKIASAIEKLREREMTVTEIAASCGFNTIRSFNRVFKELTGYSPSALPQNYVFLYSLNESADLDPTLNCTRIVE